MEGLYEKGQNFYNLSENSFGGNILTTDCFFNLLSPERIGQENFNANAKYNASLVWSGKSSLAFGNNSKNWIAGIISVSSLRNQITSSNSSSVSLVYFSNTSLCFSTSTQRNSGVISSNFLNNEFIKNTLYGTPFLNKQEITMSLQQA